jgi:hypothetical protein
MNLLDIGLMPSKRFWRVMKDNRQSPVTELRELGDNKTLVLYTNDNQVYSKIRNSIDYVKIVPYEQEQRGKLVMVGVDIHVLKKHRKWLEANIGVNT